MISDVKSNAKLGEWGPGLRFKSRILGYVILKKGHQPGVYVPLRALFLVFQIFFQNVVDYNGKFRQLAPD